MSFSRSMARLQVTVGVAIQRTIGRILALGKKNINLKTKILPNYFGWKYVKKLQTPIIITQDLKKTNSKEIIWQFWDNPPERPTTPAIVNACMKSAEKWHGDFDLKVLNMNTIGNYSDLPGYMFDRLKNRQMIFAHFSDVLRLNLLKNNGGLWIDPTCFLTGPIPKYVTDEDFFVFLTDKMTHFPYSFMQNFFIRAKKESYLNRAWLDLCLAYWKDETKDIDYFQHQLLFKALVTKSAIGRELFRDMPHISEDETLQFVGTKLFDKFDSKEWERIKNLSFVQKVTYKSGPHTLADPKNFPGSFFTKMANGDL